MFQYDYRFLSDSYCILPLYVYTAQNHILAGYHELLQGESSRCYAQPEIILKIF